MQKTEVLEWQVLGRGQARPHNGGRPRPEARGAAELEPAADLVLIWESSFKNTRQTAAVHTYPAGTHPAISKEVLHVENLAKY